MGARRQGGISGEEEWRKIAKAGNYCVERAAAMNGFSSRQFYRVFQNEMKSPPKKWFKEQQLGFGRAVLLKTGSVKTAAYECGYTQVPNVCRDFKKYFGCPATRILNG